MEQEKFEHKQKVEHLNSELLRIKTEMSTCQANFSEHKQKSRKRIDSYLDETVELESKLKAFQNVVYKTGESITTIQKFTLKPSPKGHGFALGDNKPHFLHTTLKENPKLYSAEHVFDDLIMRVVLYNCEEEQEQEDESRSKMSFKPYPIPFD